MFWTFRWWEIRSFFQPKSRWKDDIYLVLLSFPWYSRTWEIWYFVQCFSRTLTTDKGTNIVKNICVTEEPFLSKTTTDTACETILFSKFVCILFLISHERIQILKASWGVAIESFSIEPKETTMHSVLKKDVFQILEELMLYFIPIKAWVENLHTKNCVKNLMVIMPSYFRRAIKDKTWKSFGEEGLFSNIANI